MRTWKHHGRSPCQLPRAASWYAAGRACEDICGSLEEGGGRDTVIVSYTCDDIGNFAAMTAWARSEGQLERGGSRGPQGDQPGRMYIAARYALGTGEIMDLLENNPHGFGFELLHPE